MRFLLIAALALVTPAAADWLSDGDKALNPRFRCGRLEGLAGSKSTGSEICG